MSPGRVDPRICRRRPAGFPIPNDPIHAPTIPLTIAGGRPYNKYRIVPRGPMDVSGKRRILIGAGGLSLRAEIYENETGDVILKRLPVTGRANRWGEEIYFSIPVSLTCAPDARVIVRKGELGYWPDGNALCIFFGKTPVSRGDEIRAASPVNIFGMIIDDPTELTAVDDGSPVIVERA